MRAPQAHAKTALKYRSYIQPRPVHIRKAKIIRSQTCKVSRVFFSTIQWTASRNPLCDNTVPVKQMCQWNCSAVGVHGIERWPPMEWNWITQSCGLEQTCWDGQTAMAQQLFLQHSYSVTKYSENHITYVGLYICTFMPARFYNNHVCTGLYILLVHLICTS
jgi:hypothetical protein